MFRCELLCIFCFFKQKTAYEMRISDWSSDVCSSDLGVTYTEEVFSSAPADVLMIRLTVSEPGKLNAAFSLTRWDDEHTDSLKDCHVMARGTGSLLLEGQIVDKAGEAGPGGAHMKFAGLLRVLSPDGKIVAGDGPLVLNDASQANDRKSKSLN